METDIQKNVLEKIRAGEVPMRSRFFFALRTFGIDVFAFVIFALSLFTLSFVIFTIHEINELSAVGVGWSGSGVLAFAGLFPWLSLLAAVALLVFLETLLRHFRFGYRLPALRLFVWTTIIVVAGSILVELTPLHPYLREQTERENFPVLNTLYGQANNLRP